MRPYEYGKENGVGISVMSDVIDLFGFRSQVPLTRPQFGPKGIQHTGKAGSVQAPNGSSPNDNSSPAENQKASKSEETVVENKEEKSSGDGKTE